MGLREELRQITADTKQLRQFGLTLAVVFGLLGALALRRGGTLAPVLLGLPVLLLGGGLFAPAWLRWPHRWWMRISLVLGWVMTRVLLTLLWYLVVTPIGLVARMLGKHFIELAIDRSATSYWVSEPRNIPNRKDYERQF